MPLRHAMRPLRRVFLVVCLLGLLSRAARAETVQERLDRADAAYKSSNYGLVLKLLGTLEDVDAFPEKADRILGFKLMALCHFFMKDLHQAHEDFFFLLKQDPDYQLDPFLDTEEAVKFFESVRQEENPNLAPIRLAIQKDREEEEARRKRERDTQRVADLNHQLGNQALEKTKTIVERKVVQNSTLVAWMPFGLGQFQNGNTKLGMAFGIGEGISAVSSIACYLAVEAMREQDNTFSAANYPFARRFNGAKWISAGIFYALWLAGAIEANVNFVPERVIGEAPLGADGLPMGRPDRPVVPTPGKVDAPAGTGPQPAPITPEHAPKVSPASTRGPRTETESNAPAPASTHTVVATPLTNSGS